MIDRAPAKNPRQRAMFHRRAERALQRIHQRRGYKFRHAAIERSQMRQIQRLGLRGWLLMRMNAP